MSFLEAGEVRLIANAYKSVGRDVTDYELEKENLWHTIKVAMINGNMSVDFRYASRFRDNLINMLMGYGFKMTYDDEFLTIGWGAE